MENVKAVTVWVLKTFYLVQQELNKPPIDINKLRATIQQQLCAIDKSQLDYNARYAICALLDEVIMRSDPTRWQAQLLQLEYFGENTAGEQFFHKLSLLMQQEQKSMLVLMVYFLCLQLGFAGKYFDKDHQQLRQITRELRELLNAYYQPEDILLHTLVPNRKRLKPWLSFRYFNYALLISIILSWGIFKLISYFQASHMTQQLHLLSLIN